MWSFPDTRSAPRLGTLSSILTTARDRGYNCEQIDVSKLRLPSRGERYEAPHFTVEQLQRILTIAEEPWHTLFCILTMDGLRAGEVTALKVSSLDFKRKLIHITGALDYATRKESTPKSDNGAAPVCMSELLTKHLRDWLDKHYKPRPDGYLFTNSKGKPYLSDNVVRYGVHRAIAKLGIETAKDVHVGIHCFRHGVTPELLELGTPIHVVTRLMRHADSKVTLEHYAHIVGNVERVASEKFSQRIGQNITQLESDSELESTSAVKTA